MIDRLSLAKKFVGPKKRSKSFTREIVLKCFHESDIKVIVIPEATKYEALFTKIEDIFGTGVFIQKYEDHQGDLITVDSEEAITEAFDLYDKAAKRLKHSEPVTYLKLYLSSPSSPPTVSLTQSSPAVRKPKQSRNHKLGPSNPLPSTGPYSSPKEKRKPKKTKEEKDKNKSVILI